MARSHLLLAQQKNRPGHSGQTAHWANAARRRQISQGHEPKMEDKVFSRAGRTLDLRKTARESLTVKIVETVLPLADHYFFLVCINSYYWINLSERYSSMKSNLTLFFLFRECMGSPPEYIVLYVCYLFIFVSNLMF